MRWRQITALLFAGWQLAGCGGSSPSRSSSASAPAGGTTAVPTASISASTAPRTPSATTTTSAQNRTAPDTNARLPAQFTIRAGGVLDPPRIAGPKHTDVAITVVSGDGKTHSIRLDTPHPHQAVARRGGPARLLLKGLPNGSYPVEVDHVERGFLVIGVAPGP